MDLDSSAEEEVISDTGGTDDAAGDDAAAAGTGGEDGVLRLRLPPLPCAPVQPAVSFEAARPGSWYRWCLSRPGFKYAAGAPFQLLHKGDDTVRLWDASCGSGDITLARSEVVSIHELAQAPPATEPAAEPVVKRRRITGGAAAGQAERCGELRRDLKVTGTALRRWRAKPRSARVAARLEGLEARRAVLVAELRRVYGQLPAR